MSRLTRAVTALTAPEPRLAIPEMTRSTAAPQARMATVVSNPRNRGDVGPYQSPHVGEALRASRVPPGARQISELYRAREACRDLWLRSPMIGGYGRLIRIQALGTEPATLHFDRLTREQTAKLKEPCAWLRNEWRRYQTMRGVGGTGRSIHQMAGSVLHHVVIDGDCFLTNRRVGGKRVWDLHPGDALAEGQYRTAMGGRRGNRILGIETDGYGRAVRFFFRHGGLLDPLNTEYSYGGQSGAGFGFAANRVQHIRVLSDEITAARGWPWPVQVIDDIALLNQWYQAGARSATMRASIGLALKRMEGFGAPPPIVDDMAGMAGAGQALAEEFANQRIPRYQEFQRNAGSIMEMDPGWEVQNIQSPAPTAQEALMVAMLERRVCANMRVSPATLLGDYKAVSFSGGQLAVMQEQEMIKETQALLGEQYYAPIYRDWLNDPVRFLDFISMFPEIDPAKDLDALMYPQFRLKRYQVLELSKTIKPLLEGWNAGAFTYAELRQHLGFIGADVDGTIAEWKEDRKRLGLPETPSEGGGMGGEPPGVESDEDESDDGEKEDEDDE